MCRFENDVHAQEEAIALIACLATDVELVWHQSAVEGIHSMILKAMSTFEEEVFLSEISLEALGKYSSTNGYSTMLSPFSSFLSDVYSSIQFVFKTSTAAFV